jgi:hypothetical protein
LHAGGQEFDPPRLHQIAVQFLKIEPTPKHADAMTLLRCWFGCAVRGVSGWRPAEGGSRLFNNLEIRSRIVIPESALFGFARARLFSVNDNAGTDRLHSRLACVIDQLKMRLGNRSARSRPRQTLPARCRVKARHIGLYGQAFKCIWWMPWQLKAMKDVVACDMPRGVGKQTLIRGFPNGETHRLRTVSSPE